MPEQKAVTLTFGNAAAWSGAQCSLSTARAARRVSMVTHDSRQVEQNGLFVALKTERDDGHRYVSQALSQGAGAALVSSRGVRQVPERYRDRLLVVGNPLKALQRMAARYRREMGLLVVGVTGSSGKTTTRTFMASVLDARVPTGSTRGNWNNHIGMPLSLLSLQGDEYAAVIEMGANHVGEIHTLTRIARPDIAVITNVGYGHVGLFGSLANTTRAKLEIADGLPRRKGILLVNGDDRRLLKAARSLGVSLHTFGFGAKNDCAADLVTSDASGTTFRVSGDTYRLRIPGRHFVYAALPSIALGLRVGLSPNEIARVLQQQRPVSMRGGVRRRKGVSFVLDCYNANPDSMRSALALLSDLCPSKRRVAVLGEMLELGPYAKRLHKRLGRDAAAAGLRELIAVGPHAADIASGARDGGMGSRRIRTAADAQSAADTLNTTARAGDTVLLKASRGMRLEDVFSRFGR